MCSCSSTECTADVFTEWPVFLPDIGLIVLPSVPGTSVIPVLRIVFYLAP